MSDRLIYGAASKDYAAVGLRSVPTGGEDGKKPLIAHWPKVRPRTALALAEKFPTANIGLISGDPGGVTLVDIDDCYLIEDCIRRFGDTPVKVRTPSGGAHLYYRANDERRIIRLKNEKIDILGRGGLAIAPPSTNPKKGPYVFEEGGLTDFAHLPTIRSGSLPANAYLEERLSSGQARGSDPSIAKCDERIPDGRRGSWLFRRALQLVRGCDSFDELIELLRIGNQSCVPPKSDAEVVKTAKSAWKYEQNGTNWLGKEPRAQLFQSEFCRLHQHSDAIGLLLELRLAHACRDGDFVLANALAKKFGWGLNRFRKARTILVEKGYLIPTHEGGKGPHDPPCYRFGR